MNRTHPPLPLALLAVLIALITLGSCVPQGGQRQTLFNAQGGRGNSANTPSPNPPSTPQPPEDKQLYWFTQQNQGTSLPLSAQSPRAFFLRGSSVESFLQKPSHFNTNYCLALQFATSSPRTQLLMRGTPTQLRMASSGHKIRLLRFEPANQSDNRQLCQNLIPGIAPSQTAYLPSQLCQGSACPGKTLASTSLKLWQLSPAPQLITQINLTKHSVHLQLNAIPPSSSTSCSNRSCQALGFDCCLPSQQQCVNDGELKPSAHTLPHFAQAQAQVSSNPQRYVHWPEIYFVCPEGSIAPGNNGPGPGTVPPHITQLTDNYLCQEGELSRCNPDQATVVGQIQLICGCPTPNTCPHLKYDTLKDQQGNIIEIFCHNTSTPPPSIQDQRVQLNTRSVPHRFFRTSDGLPIDDLHSLKKNNHPQEGHDFFYLNQQAKVGAQNGPFNINSILGPMALTLDQALPALTVPIKFDQIYIISATSGYSSPCPLCPQDQWYNQFSAHPTIAGVDGLIAVGYGTRRDEFQQNTTNGNYEDTKFGRACWIPPTMIPFSHQANNKTATQRLNRLETQAAFYLNGYQRDWFGFNKGAVIGSFDGVTWFAIGNGRRVQAKSHKLFLAINAPFADLATQGSIEVSIREDVNAQGKTPDYDYDPSLSGPQDPRYNQAASCQQYHQCQVDADCITQLGWEYMCANITNWKTLLPRFDLKAHEQAQQQLTRSKNTFPVGGLAPSSSRKRCVYRGMGALCQRQPLPHHQR